MTNMHQYYHYVLWPYILFMVFLSLIQLINLVWRCYYWCYLMFCYCVYVVFNRMTFKTDPDTHIDSLERAEDNVLEGTSHWSCKIAVEGQISRQYPTNIPPVSHSIPPIPHQFPTVTLSLSPLYPLQGSNLYTQKSDSLNSRIFFI